MDERLQDLLAERARARAAKDFARADAVRDEIEAAGFTVTDTPEGPRLQRILPTVEAHEIASHLDEPASVPVSLHVLYEGFAGDLERFLVGLERTNDVSRAEVVVVDNASADADAIHDLCLPRPYVRPLHLSREVGWAEARNAGLRSGRGTIVVVADLSVEPTGDILGPLETAFADRTVGLAGPFGLVSDDLREWRPTEGPEADAIEGYLLAARRELLAGELFDERFRWYRNADIELSLRLRSLGARAVVVPLPLRRYEHRGWEALDEQRRERLSKRNYSLLLDRWRDREDLLLANRT